MNMIMNSQRLAQCYLPNQIPDNVMGVKKRVQDGNTYYYAFPCQNFYSAHPFS